ncbi:MAG TPA: preprotein translocase subunit YajC [Candidatus Acidoferrales bacterium]|nr:preprotein translocase subunit YajC [Candidatus Acidoferrales bacterium]
MLLVSTALAQTAAAAAAPSSPFAQFFGGPSSSLVMLLLMGLIFYFLILRPQSQEKKKLENAISQLQKGDKVITTSGIVATVVTIDKQRAVLRIADDVKVEFVRTAIAQVVSRESA